MQRYLVHVTFSNNVRNIKSVNAPSNFKLKIYFAINFITMRDTKKLYYSFFVGNSILYKKGFLIFFRISRSFHVLAEIRKYKKKLKFKTRIFLEICWMETNNKRLFCRKFDCLRKMSLGSYSGLGLSLISIKSHDKC